MVAQWDNKCIWLSVLLVGRVQFPAITEYFMGFFHGWSHSANLSWASMAENGSISPQLYHTTCGNWGGRPKSNHRQTMAEVKQKKRLCLLRIVLCGECCTSKHAFYWYQFSNDFMQAWKVDDLDMTYYDILFQSQNESKKEYLFKILVIGELGAGKTSIIKRYVHQYFSQHYRATVSTPACPW